MNESDQDHLPGAAAGSGGAFPDQQPGAYGADPGVARLELVRQSDNFLPIVVTLHLGTAAALVLFYWRDWYALIRAFFKTAIKGGWTPIRWARRSGC